MRNEDERFLLWRGLDFITAQESTTRCNKSDASEAPMCQRNSNKLCSRSGIQLTETVKSCTITGT